MKYFFLTILLMGKLLATAQQPDITFHHITQKEGLSYNIINSFLKDSRGMLWIGTYNGLNKYDGQHFYVYRKGLAKNTLPNNTVHELVEDQQGRIWGATDGGIFCMNTFTGNFKAYRTPVKNNSPPVANIYCDKADDIWATNSLGLMKLNKAADSFEVAPGGVQHFNNNEGYMVRKNGLAESPDGKGFWMATRSGLIYYDKLTHRYLSSANSNGNRLFSSKSASAIGITPYGHYWFFDNTKMQLVGFDPLQKTVKYSIQPKEFTPVSFGATLYEDKDHLLWLSTWNYEIFNIDYLHGNKVTRIKHDDNNISTVAGDFFWDVRQDADGTLWLGTVGGISKCNTNRSFYKVHHLPRSKQTTDGAAVEFFVENKLDSTWWIVTSDNELLHYDPVNTETKFYDISAFEKNKHGDIPVYVTKMLFLKDKILLVSASGSWIKQGSGSFRPMVLPAPADTVLLKSALFYNDSIIYCTDYKQVLRWNIHSGKMEPLSLLPVAAIKPNPYLFTLFTARPGSRVWMLLAPDWLGYIEGNSIVPVKFSSVEKDGNDGYYTSMDMDADGNLWIAKKGDGLFYYNPAQKKYRLFKQSDGLVMDHVMAVSAGPNGKVWAGAYNQFSVYSTLMNSFYNFTLPLSTNSYQYSNHMISLANGNIIANVANDIVEFFPARLKQDAVNEQPIISMLKAGGNTKVLEANKVISLEPGENSLQIKFGLHTDIEASPYDMLYKLEGAEKEWTTANNIFEASYNSLPPGNYTFKVKALAKDKSWQTRETVLQIYIRTPFYKAWWFKVLLAVLFFVSVILFYRYRISQKEKLLQLESKAQLLEKEKTMVLYESLKQQLNPHFLFNSLTSLSGLIEADQKMAGNFLEQMSKIYRYILKSSETETVTLKEELQFVQLYISLQTTRFEKGLQVNIDVPEEFQHYKIAPVTLQNMIENAIKHNIIDVDSPLVIEIFIEEDYVVVKNNLQKKNKVETSNKQGLESLKKLYRYLSQQPVVVNETALYYEIRIPLI